MLSEEKIIPFEALPSSCFYRNSWKFLQHLSTLTSARPLKVIIARKNAKDLQGGGRFPKRVSMQCVSFLISSVRRHFKTQLQACRWKRIKFCDRYLYFSFTNMIRAFRLLLSYIEGKPDECWLLVLLTKFGCCSNQTDEIVFFSKKKIVQVVGWNVQHFRKFSRHNSCWYVPRPRLTGIRNIRSNDTAQSVSFV